MKPPDKEQWAAWLEDPCTIALREIMRIRIETLKEVWANGGFSDDPGLNSKAIGQIQSYAEILNMHYEALVITELTEEKDEQRGREIGGVYIWPDAPGDPRGA